MTVTMLPVIPLNDNRLRLLWTSDATNPTFYVYRDGEIYTTTTATAIDVMLATGETPVWQVLDDAEAQPLAGYPGRFTLCWWESADTEYYRVDEYIDSTWTERARIEDDEREFFVWESRWLEDCQTHQFRVVPVGTNGNEGTAATLSALMVRYPSPPSVSFEYSNTTHKITISAA